MSERLDFKTPVWETALVRIRRGRSTRYVRPVEIRCYPDGAITVAVFKARKDGSIYGRSGFVEWLPATAFRDAETIEVAS